MWEHRGIRDRRVVCYAMLLLLAPNPRRDGQTAQPNALRHQVCRYGKWSRPHWLEAPTPLLKAIRFPTAALSRASSSPVIASSTHSASGYTVGVSGFLATQFARPGWPAQWPPRLRAVRLDGARSQAPSSGFWYAYPRAVVDGAGILHVIWAEPDDKLPTDPRMLNEKLPVLRSLWYVTLSAGKWSRARRIYRGRGLEWDEVRSTRLIVDDLNGLHVAFVADDTTGPGVTYLRANGQPTRHWRATRVRQMGVAYLDLSVAERQRVAIAFVSSGGAAPSRANVLFLTQSRDGGNTWTSARAISAPGEDPATEPHVFFDSNLQDVQLEWVQQPIGAFTGGSMWRTTVTATGRRSTTALALPPDVMTAGSQAAIDRCGTLHVFTQAYPNGSSELRYARATADGWTAWSRPFDIPGAHAALAVSAGSLHVVWNSSAMSTPDSLPISALAHATLPILGP